MYETVSNSITFLTQQTFFESMIFFKIGEQIVKIIFLWTFSKMSWTFFSDFWICFDYTIIFFKIMNMILFPDHFSKLWFFYNIANNFAKPPTFFKSAIFYDFLNIFEFTYILCFLSNLFFQKLKTFKILKSGINLKKKENRKDKKVKWEETGE